MTEPEKAPSTFTQAQLLTASKASYKAGWKACCETLRRNASSTAGPAEVREVMIRIANSLARIADL